MRSKGTGSIVKLVTYQLDGKNVSKSAPGAVRVESTNWYILYRGRDGKQRREATGTASRTRAEVLLIERVGEVRVGKTPAQDLKTLRYEDIRTSYFREKPEQANYSGLKYIDGFFRDRRVLHITTDVIRDFIDYRREEDEAADPTIRRNLVVLRAMFNLARKEGRLGLGDIPYFPMPEDSAPAGQYIEPAQFADILNALDAERQRKLLEDPHAPDLKPFFTFMYATGCRLGALQRITWDMVKSDCTQISLPGKIVKTKEALLIVLAGSLLSPIAAMLRRMFRDPSKPVFDFTNYRPEWNKAVAAAKLGTLDPKTRRRTGVRIHDCRCSAAINLLAAGVDEGLVLKIGGWKTRAMLDRYNVQHAGRIKAAMERGGKFVEEQQSAAR